jgi:hypothetical protein
MQRKKNLKNLKNLRKIINILKIINQHKRTYNLDKNCKIKKFLFKDRINFIKINF